MRTANPRWDRRDLRRRLAAALEVAERSVRLLGPTGYRADEPDGIRPEKVLAETALFLLASQQACACHDSLADLHRRIAGALVPFARSRRAAALIVLEPLLALDHALVHLCLSRLGLGDQGFDRLLAAALEARASATRERLPHRMMERDWLLRLAGSRAGGQARLPAGSILRRPLDALAATADDLYAFTHAVMFGTEMGARLLRLPRHAADIIADAEAALACCLDDEDYDLAGELLLTWPLLRQPWSAAATFGFCCLARVEDAAGFLPSRDVSAERLAPLAGEERSRCALAMTYHTIYVMGLLGALSLRDDAAPPRTVTAADGDRGTAALLAVPDPDERPRHWQEAFDELAAGQQEALAPLLLTVRLRRAAARRDLAAVRDLLAVAARYDLLAEPAPQQAIELLRRAALLSEQTSLA